MLLTTVCICHPEYLHILLKEHKVSIICSVKKQKVETALTCKISTTKQTLVDFVTNADAVLLLQQSVDLAKHV